MDEMSRLWGTIESLAGASFHTKRGKPFSYDCSASAVHLRNTNRSLPRSDFAKALARSPLRGPVALQDLQGPSYIYAILTDPRVSGAPASPEQSAGPRLSVQRRATPAKSNSLRKGDVDRPRPGHAVTRAELRRIGFVPHKLRFRTGVIDMIEGTGCEWDTIGQIPTGPGLYAFTVHDTVPDPVRVMYVGMTTHLWMVTKGTLPGWIARGGQRYGRPKHAGLTRRRVNVEVAKARAAGLEVMHWLQPVALPDGADAKDVLREHEEELIARWDLRRMGWNRG